VEGTFDRPEIKAFRSWLLAELASTAAKRPAPARRSRRQSAPRK
jgi:hypothetical protein